MFINFSTMIRKIHKKNEHRRNGELFVISFHEKCSLSLLTVVNKVVK